MRVINKVKTAVRRARGIDGLTPVPVSPGSSGKALAIAKHNAGVTRSQDRRVKDTSPVFNLSPVPMPEDEHDRGRLAQPQYPALDEVTTRRQPNPNPNPRDITSLALPTPVDVSNAYQPRSKEQLSKAFGKDAVDPSKLRQIEAWLESHGFPWEPDRDVIEIIIQSMPTASVAKLGAEVKRAMTTNQWDWDGDAAPGKAKDAGYKNTKKADWIKPGDKVRHKGEVITVAKVYTYPNGAVHVTPASGEAFVMYKDPNDEMVHDGLPTPVPVGRAKDEGKTGWGGWVNGQGFVYYIDGWICGNVSKDKGSWRGVGAKGSERKFKTEEEARRYVESAAPADRERIRREHGKDALRGLTPVGKAKDGPWDDNVARLTENIKKEVRAQKADGTVSMSKANLKQMVKSGGLHFPNENAFERAFEEALVKAGVGKFVHATDALRPIGKAKDGGVPSKGIYVEFDKRKGQFFKLSNDSDAQVDAACKKAGLYKKGGDYPSFTIFDDGEEIGGGGGPNSGIMDALRPIGV